MSTIYDPTLNIMNSLSTLFSTDNNPQVPKTETPVQQGQTPKVDQPDYGKTWNLISTTLTPDSQHWGRKEWRNWRKQQGLSKQEMRNVRAAALSGRQAPVNVSRRELREMENLMGTQGYTRAIGQADQKITGLTNALNGITNWSGTINTDPIEIEEEIIEEAPLPGQPPVTGITYSWGDTVNNYWKAQNEKVLNSLSDEERRKIAGDDGVITAEEARAWQQGMGLSGDLKFGTGTIGAATSKYGDGFKSGEFNGYVNPAVAKKQNEQKRINDWNVQMQSFGYMQNKRNDGTFSYTDHQGNVYFSNNRMKTADGKMVNYDPNQLKMSR